MTDRVPTVAYVAGRRTALARAIAIEGARLQGFTWDALPERERIRLVSDAEKIVAAWVTSGVLLEFFGEYRENV